MLAAVGEWWTAFKAWSILCGILGTVPYVVIRFWRTGKYDPGSFVVMFIATSSLPTGFACLRAAMAGNPATLPSTWPEYVGAAGLGFVLFTMHWAWQAYKKAWREPRTQRPVRGAPPNVAQQ